MRNMVAGVSAASVILLSGATGCGETTGSFPEAATSPSSSPAGVARRATQIFEDMAGTPDQRVALEVVIAYKLNGAFSECLAERGYDQPWQNFIAVPSHRDALTASVWGMDPDQGQGYFTSRAVNTAAGGRAGYSAEILTTEAQAPPRMHAAQALRRSAMTPSTPCANRMGTATSRRHGRRSRRRPAHPWLPCRRIRHASKRRCLRP